jgi:hypothetical protein
MVMDPHGRKGPLRASVSFAVALTLASLGLFLAACGGDDGDAEAPEANAVQDRAPASAYVGRVEGSDAFVALVAEGSRLVGYVCDGREVSSWLEGSSFEDGRAQLENRDGQAVGEATLDPASASGEVEVDGASHRFTAELAEDSAGLFRRTRGEPGEEGFRETGWIVLDDGSVKGTTSFLLGDGSVRTTGITDGTSNTARDRVTSADFSTHSGGVN